MGTTISNNICCNNIDKAAEKGHLACMKYLHENGCPCNMWTCIHAASNGNLECLKYAHKNCNLNCFKYLHENGATWDEIICNQKSTKDHINCLKYAHENGALWDRWSCVSAVQNGHLECLKYAHEKVCTSMGKCKSINKYNLEQKKYYRCSYESNRCN